MYWIGVYALIIGAVLTGFLVFYVLLAAFWLAAKAIRLIIRGLRGLPAFRTPHAGRYWSFIHR
jgi:hypothetical protein